MKHKFLSSFIYFWAVICISNGISMLDYDPNRPFWQLFHPCAIELPLGSLNPNIMFCDPDKTLNDNEISNLRSYMNSCSEKMTSIANETKVFIFAFENINIKGNELLNTTSIELFLRHLTTRWLSFLNEPIFMVITVKESNEALEWHSESVKMAGNYDKPGQSFQEQLGSLDQNFIATLLRIQNVVCERIISWYSPSQSSLSSILWIILSTVIITGSFAFGCWIYRFNKSHPTTEETDNYEMTQHVFYDEDGNPLPTTCSGYVLSQDEIEAASPDPAKTTTHEALDRI